MLRLFSRNGGQARLAWVKPQVPEVFLEMPMIHLQVCAGFANRVRALVSGICLSEDLSIPLVIHWFPMSPECACRFGSVLDAESLPKPVKVVPEDLFQAQEVNSLEAWAPVFQRWDQKSDLYLKSYSIFYTNESYDKHLRSIRPSSFVKDFLARRTASVDWSKAVGVHIRRGDNKKSIEHSPVESFVQKMREATGRFFVLATDDQKVRERMMIEFGDRCVFPAMTLSRKTEEGMIHGVADFFALTKCTEIWGSYWSSFSDIAAKYGSIPLTIV
jgi:hypothetical protein